MRAVAEPFRVSMDEEGLSALAALARRVHAAAEDAAGGSRFSAFADLAITAGALAAWASMAAREVKAGGAEAVRSGRPVAAP